MIDNSPKDKKSEIDSKKYKEIDKNNNKYPDDGKIVLVIFIVGFVIGFLKCFYRCYNFDDYESPVLGSLGVWILYSFIALVLGAIVVAALMAKRKHEEKQYRTEAQIEYKEYEKGYSSEKEKLLKLYDTSPVTEDIVYTISKRFEKEIRDIPRDYTVEKIYKKLSCGVNKDYAGGYYFKEHSVLPLTRYIEQEALAEILGKKISVRLKKLLPVDPSGGENLITYSSEGRDIYIIYRANNNNYKVKRNW